MTHRLQLFDTPETLAAAVGSFVVDGYYASGNLLVIARPAQRAAIVDYVIGAGCFSEEVSGTQRLVALDAQEILDRISVDGRIDAARFEAVVAPLVQRLASAGPLFVYGEVVELLAAREDFAGAIALEELWNNLAQRCPFTLLCGYSAEHFVDPSRAAALTAICATHTTFSVL